MMLQSPVESAGTIISNPPTATGFDFERIFVPNGYTQTLAEIDDNVKNTFSHRAQALQQMAKLLHEKDWHDRIRFKAKL